MRVQLVFINEGQNLVNIILHIVITENLHHCNTLLLATICKRVELYTPLGIGQNNFEILILFVGFIVQYRYFQLILHLTRAEFDLTFHVFVVFTCHSTPLFTSVGARDPGSAPLFTFNRQGNFPVTFRAYVGVLGPSKNSWVIVIKYGYRCFRNTKKNRHRTLGLCQLNDEIYIPVIRIIIDNFNLDLFGFLMRRKFQLSRSSVVFGSVFCRTILRLV
mmetsp:Transcript_145787/g.254533  ORF Transcript_145787/g.254533 Transcript_145787/m.254533 type:complete len:218 (+) Transcript_145787:2249-2902(+)